jgi:hypothetical protein
LIFYGLDGILIAIINIGEQAMQKNTEDRSVQPSPSSDFQLVAAGASPDERKEEKLKFLKAARSIFNRKKEDYCNER